MPSADAGLGKVVVGFDAKEASLDALRLGRELAEAAGAELHVAAVLPRRTAPFEEAIVEPPVSDQLEEVLFASAATGLDGFAFTPVRLDGGLGGRSAARALHEYGIDQSAGAIVVGSTHRGRVGRVLAGSVGESLLRGGPCAVAVAPRGYADHPRAPFHRIGVAYDGTAEADIALGVAKRLAGDRSATLRVITVVPGIPGFDLSGLELEAVLDAQRREYRHVLDAAVAAANGEVAVEPVLREGDPAKVLSLQGLELDLLVIGSRGYGPVRGSLLGAVSAAVTRNALCPVLVTPRGIAGGAELGSEVALAEYGAGV